MSRFDRPPASDSGLPARLRAGASTDLERRVLDAAANEQPSRELCERMALAIGVAPPSPTIIEQGPVDLGASSAVGGASRSLLTWLSAGVVVAVAAVAIVATRSSERPATPSRLAPVPSQLSPQPAETPSPVGGSAAPSIPALSPPAASAATAPTPSLRSRPAQPAADIRGEIALIDAARAAVAARASNRALGLVRQYQGKYPSGSFRPEAAALKIEALSQLGRNEEARGLAAGFASEYGAGPLADRVSRRSSREQP